MTQNSDTRPCPCGSGKAYNECCQPFHLGKPAPSPEALMRSRYSAFVLGLPDYLRDTWHESARPADLSLDSSPEWTALNILSSGENDDTGTVHFRAVYRLGQGWGFLEEESRFAWEDGRWFYLRGDTREGQLKPGRNEPCPCGSGRKFKACCL
ncbi:YchJ family protein [Marinobacter sp.]|uniref:YchJ family protein n=1 Tax=Marinobacter sp. TaxID=50741 RepID=UPI0035C6B265